MLSTDLTLTEEQVRVQRKVRHIPDASDKSNALDKNPTLDVRERELQDTAPPRRLANHDSPMCLFVAALKICIVSPIQASAPSFPASAVK